MVGKVDHIGIAVKNLEESLKFYEDVLGIKCVADEVVEEQKVKTAFLPLGDTEIELLESTSEDGPIAKFIEKKGEGIQHIAYKVDDIEKALEELKAKPNSIFALASRSFSTFGVLIEICERG